MNHSSDFRPACVILASGSGRRFGANKLLAPFHGKPLLSVALSHLPSELFCQQLVVTRNEEAAALCHAHQVPVLLHDMPQKSDTIRLAVRTMQNASGCLFAVADQPLLTTSSILRMTRAFANHPHHIIRLYFGDTPGNPVIFPSNLFSELSHLTDEQGGNAIINQYPSRVLRVQAQSALELQDCDTREALKRLEQLSK